MSETLQHEQQLPPVPEGSIRLYRGDIVDEAREPIIQDVTGRATASDTAGRWFTDNPNDAEGYAAGRQAANQGSYRRNSFIDVPLEVATEYNARSLPPEEIRAANGGHAFVNEWILPREIVDTATEYQVQDVDQQYEPAVEEGLQAVFARPEVRSVLEEMDLDDERLEDITSKPIHLQELLEQLSMMLGQNQLHVADREDLASQLRQLHLGAESAHKQRLLGPEPATHFQPELYAPVTETQRVDDW